jgi:protease-4
MQTMGSATVAGALRDAIEDEVEAIVFRVDSPGGSYVASDTIWRETIRAKEAGIPVIVTMGNVAGSGGYFVAMAADAIVAQPSTITASIGVLGGKRLTRPAWAKLGLSFDDVSTSANATMWSGGHDYTEYGWSRFQAWLDRVYEDFTSKVAEGRGLPKEKVLEIAKGRVWTGADALELGLVDELGGLTTAIRLAKEAADIPADDGIRLKLYPSPKTPFQTFFGEGPDNSGAIRESLVRALQIVQPMARLAREVGLLEQEGALMTPQVPTAN